eukprot:41263_1
METWHVASCILRKHSSYLSLLLHIILNIARDHPCTQYIHSIILSLHAMKQEINIHCLSHILLWKIQNTNPINAVYLCKVPGKIGFIIFICIIIQVHGAKIIYI